MSEGGDDAQEKTHEASARKIERAREKGDVAHSQDAQTAAAYLGFAIAMALSAGAVAQGVGDALAQLLAHPAAVGRAMLGGAAAEVTATLAGKVGLAVLPILAAPALLVVALLGAMRRIVVAPSKLAPKLSRLSPVENAKQKYGARGLVEFAKSSAKLAAVSGVLALALRGESERLAQYAHVEARLIGGLLEAQFWSILTGVIAVAVVVGIVDLLWQQHHHRSKLRMSHEELKEESKESEGDPYMRASRRERAREIATNRMLLDVPKADVVITNPTHYAVALAWDRTPGSAPRCLAKGVDEVAAAIRRRATEAGVPMHPDPPTARALHALVDLGEEIRPDHFRAVAAAIVFADDMRRRKRATGGWQGGGAEASRGTAGSGEAGR